MSAARRHAHNLALVALVATLLATGVAEALYRSGAVARLENLYTDLWHRLAGQRHVPSNVALVMLDDPTLNERPDEPLAFWTPHFAKAVGRDRQIRRVVIIERDEDRRQEGERRHTES